MSERDTILIDGAPEIVLHATDPDEDFVHVPRVPWPWPAASRAVGESSGRISCTSAVRSR